MEPRPALPLSVLPGLLGLDLHLRSLLWPPRLGLGAGPSFLVPLPRPLRAPSGALSTAGWASRATQEGALPSRCEVRSSCLWSGRLARSPGTRPMTLESPASL